MGTNQVVIFTYDEVKELPNHPEKLLIDVRKPSELAETGKIPASINIPIAIIEEELKLSDEDFFSKYGRKRPNVDDEIIFHCRMGGRAGKAADIAVGLGYKNVKSYKGGWCEWEQKEKL